MGNLFTSEIWTRADPDPDKNPVTATIECFGGDSIKCALDDRGITRSRALHARKLLRWSSSVIHIYVITRSIV